MTYNLKISNLDTLSNHLKLKISCYHCNIFSEIIRLLKYKVGKSECSAVSQRKLLKINIIKKTKL